MSEIDTYGKYVSQIYGMLAGFGVLEPVRWFVLFVLSIAGFLAFVSFLKGRLGG